MSYENFAKENAIEYISGEPLSKYTSFKVGGPAEIIMMPKNAVQLALIYKNFAPEEILLLGNGSNIVFSDAAYKGIIIKTEKLNKIEIKDEMVTAQCGALLTKTAAEAMTACLAGMEFASGIPGSIGGAVFMNAGAYGGEMNQIVEETLYFDGYGIKALKNKEHEFSYRHSFFSNKRYVILQTELKLSKGEKEQISAKTRELNKKRKEKQPLEYPSAGSVFKRPEGHFAGTLIEQCGLKGYSIGGAQVSQKHAGFIINTGGATCLDIKRLVEYIQKTVFEQTGISLECELLFR